MENPQVPSAAEPQGNPLQSIWGVLLAPEKTFRALAIRPTWWPAMLLLVATALGLSLVVTPRLDMKQVMREAIEEKGQDISEAQLERQAEMADKFKWIGTASQVVLQPAVYLLMAGIFLVLLRLLGSEIDFRQSLSVSVHGMMPFVIATLLTIPVVLSRASLSLKDVQSARYLHSNLAAFAPESTGKPMMALLASADLFSIWTIVLLGIGFRVVGRVSKVAALGAVIALWAVVVAGKVALAALF
ncbi:MAG: Yip1 family protein [Thermoanaerobaculia bacterium]